MRKGINISHVNIENIGGRDQSQMKNKSLKSSKKVSPFRKTYQKSHNDDIFQYLRFEINDRSGVAASLPTKGQPVEISQWTARACPASIPDFMKGGRTFMDFVDSVLRWWSSIQPSWRTFECSKPSCEVWGGWDVLHAPRINGLLNVVMLVYQ